MRKNKHDLVKDHFKKTDSVIHTAMDGIEFNKRFAANKARKNKLEVFDSLCKEIVAQQLAGKAAHAITSRLVGLFEKEKIVPEKVLELEGQQLRDVGLSWAKVKYLKDLSEKTVSGEVELEKLHKLFDEEVVEELTKVKGIGRWTAEMFLIFSLGRENIFSYGDLGLRRGFEYLYGVKNPTDEEIKQIVEKWTPYKSYGSVTLWHSLDTREDK